MYPPPLAWLDNYCKSVSFALDCTVTAEAIVSGTIAQAYVVVLSFSEPQKVEFQKSAYEIFSYFASKNDTHALKANYLSRSTIRVDVLIKRLRGPEKTDHPLG